MEVCSVLADADEMPTSVIEMMMESTTPLPDISDLLTRPTWHRHAACRGLGTPSFFPPGGSDPMAATLVCRRCPVREECLEYALAEPRLKGIWGGTSERQRHRLRAADRLQQLATADPPDTAAS
jgi:WhiB family transcriptional regulator, redox-sensing transcriptional regulator